MFFITQDPMLKCGLLTGGIPYSYFQNFLENELGYLVVRYYIIAIGTVQT